MFKHLIIYLLIIAVCMQIHVAIKIVKIVSRKPHPNDIGLIFDVTVSNNNNSNKEMIEYYIRQNGPCRLNISKNQFLCDVGRIVGADFGYIEYGQTEVVSLIFPTVSLYNRVGICPIVLTTVSSQSHYDSDKKNVTFDTRITTLDPDGNSLRKNKQYKDCNNWDLDYMNNCKPLDCEERYFGKRNFYNRTTKKCEEAAVCKEPNIYDIYSNECIYPNSFCSDEDLDLIRRGKFEEFILDLKPNDPCQPSSTNNNNNSYKRDSKRETENSNSIERGYDYYGYESWFPQMPYWLRGLVSGLFLVLATIAIYVLICFIIFVVANWLSKRNNNGCQCNKVALKSQNEYQVVPTTSETSSTNKSYNRSLSSVYSR